MTTIELEIICIGNELLIGKTLNTNAQWMAKRATQIGLAVRRITVIPDETEEIAMAIKETLKRKPSFVLTTGGLGPTFDDKTLEGLALALNRKLEINNKALKMVKEKYETYARKSHTEIVELTKPRLKMATLPKKTLPIPNPVGTAPGVQAELKQTILIALPGVPKEMEAIFEETVGPILRQASGNRNFHERSNCLEDIMESSLAPLIYDVMKDNPGVYVKSHPKGEENKPHIEIHFSTTLGKAEKPEERLDKAIQQLSEEIKSSGGRIVSEI
jgi:nicotinamide-nucleotide amidase